MRRASTILLLTIAVLWAVAPVEAAPTAKPHRRVAVIAPTPGPKAVVAAPVQAHGPSSIRLSPTPRRLGSQCRAQCAETRYACLLGGDDSDCDPRWTRCVVQCGGSAYARRPSMSAASALRPLSSAGPR